jgi:MYXO-CTERM domain-containing protein
MAKWHGHEVMLDPAWGDIQVRVSFDTVNSTSNNYAGWFVDDAQIMAIGAVSASSGPRPGGKDRSPSSVFGCSAATTAAHPGRTVAFVMLAGSLAGMALLILRRRPQS